MVTITLFYATNRAHEGSNRWQPTGYGKNFSTDRNSNLRFGKVTLNVDDHKIEKFQHRKKDGRSGDGEGLADYLAARAKKTATIRAYKDITAGGKRQATRTQLASTEIFNDLKKTMEQQQDVVINIHGFNVSWWEAVGSAMALELMLNRNPEGNKVTVFLFSWPSNGDLMKGRAYASDRRDAEDSGLAVARGFLKLRDFMMTLRPKNADPEREECGQDIHLLCHSMGNYVLQSALNHFSDEEHTPSFPRLFKHIFMCAPDVADNVFESQQPMNKAQDLCRHLSVYYNKGDLAMYISDYTKGNSERLGHAGVAKPNQLHHKIHQVDCSRLIGGLLEHNYYLWATVNDDIRQSIDAVDFQATSRNRIHLTRNESILN